MDKDRILVVEDDHKTSSYLKVYFDWLGYDVLVAGKGGDALDACRLKVPSVVILDVMLPDVNGYEICRTLRKSRRTSRVPIVFLSQRSKRNDIIAAFELGADDYVTKPFDIEELKLRVEGIIRRSRHEALIHPVTNLPAGELIIEQLRMIKDSTEPWTLLYFSIGKAGAFKEMEGSDLINESLACLADILREAVESHGTPSDFVGQASDNGFIVITIPESASVICKTVTERLDEDRFARNGAIQAAGSMKFMVGAVSSYDGPFTDIKQIAKTLAEIGFRQQKSGCPDETFGMQPRAADIEYCNQLTERVHLWQTAPELAQTLIEVEHLTAARVPDMNKVRVLFDLVGETELPVETFKNLQAQQQLCRLAYENLTELQYKIQSYQEFDPTPLIKTLEYTLDLLQKPQITISSITSSDSELVVAVPELKLRLILYNVFKWLLDHESAARLVISPEAPKDMVSLVFTPADFKADRPEISRLLGTLNQNKPGVVYGYLAHKIVSRYGGNLASDEGRITLKLPLAGQHEADASRVDIVALRQKIKKQRLYLDRQKWLTFPAHIYDKAAELIDPLAEDLLAQIEAVTAILGTSPGIDDRSYPWSAIQRNYRFFRLLTLDLRKNRPLIPAPVNLKSLLENIKPLLAHRVHSHEIIIESEIARPVINTDQTRLTQVFVNLALNALDAMPDAGTLKFHLKQADSYYIVEVIDNGSGISPQDQPRIFSRHFTTKGSGHGAGLHHVKSYLKQLNGWIEVYSEVGKGTTFTVKLPPSWEAGYF